MDDDSDDDLSETRGAAVKRDRSPNYPALTFMEALDCARRIWDRDKRHPVTKDVAAQHMGYTKASGATIPLVASMKRYGLLEAVGKELRITDDAHFIFVHPEDSAERTALIRKLALQPSLFGEVLQKFSGQLPSDATLRAKLQTEWKFASPNAADTFIRALREAVKIAESTDIALPTEDHVEEIQAARSSLAGQPLQPTLSGGQRSHATSSTSTFGNNTRAWDLGDGVVLTVQLPSTQLSRKNVERLKRYVAALEMEASIAWDDEP